MNRSAQARSAARDVVITHREDRVRWAEFAELSGAGAAGSGETGRVESRGREAEPPSDTQRMPRGEFTL
jgi:hypothetical protein